MSLGLLRNRLKNVMSPHCRHIKGRGGVKGAVRELVRRVGAFRFVARFDVASYYDSMEHHRLLKLLEQAGVDETLRALVQQYLELPDPGIVPGGEWWQAEPSHPCWELST